MAISMAITAMATMVKSCPSGAPALLIAQKPTAASIAPLMISSSPIISITKDC
jgi:hypothetical protein